jgi:protein SCO1/2
MKTIFVLLTVFVATHGLLAAGGTVPPGPEPSARPPCCAVIAPDAPLTARSLYQLDAIWKNDAGRVTKLAALRGQPVVIAMFFASCEYACPVLVSDLQRVRAALPEAVRDRAQFVLVSFDTARDTPEALAAFRERMTLDGGWTLLRGPEPAVQDLAMLLGVKYKQDARGQFAHSNLFTVLNAEGEVVHQHAGLQGDISEAAQAVMSPAK